LKQPDQHRAPRKRLSIRGARASASLKPPHNRYASGFGRRIRGARASASLKLNWLDGQAPCHATHPRRARLGLIEAYISIGADKMALDASEARAPRPH